MRSLRLRPLTQPVEVGVAIPGSKSYTIRALLLAALVEGSVWLHAPLFSDDTRAMAACLNALGIRTLSGDDSLTVTGSIRDVSPGKRYELNADLSAASLRFLIALCAVLPGEQLLFGREGLNARPVRELVDALRRMGAEIDYTERDGYPPVLVRSSQLTADAVRLNGGISSQYLSALLMIAPLLNSKALAINIEGELISKPYVDMTLDIMRTFGVTAENPNDQRFVIPGGQAYHAESYTIEADASSAAYFAAIAALTCSTITLDKLNPESKQGDMRFLDILEMMGSRIQRKNSVVKVEGGGVRPIEVDMQDCPDQVQTLAVLAAFAEGATRITGVKSLRIKETDRLHAVTTELAKMGIRTETAPDGDDEVLVIHGGNPQPAAIDTYGDHRMAMSFAVAGAKLAGLRIHDPDVVGKTFPNFWQALEHVGIGVEANGQDDTPTSSSASLVIPAKAGSHSQEIRKIVLIGFMGSGKSEVAPLLAERLGWTALDMDALIVEKSGRESVKAIFEADGEAHFRALEHQVALELQTRPHIVIATGGGVVMNPALMAALTENAAIIHLDTRFETVLARLAPKTESAQSDQALDTSRPLLQNREAAEALYAQRAPLYRGISHFTVATDEATPAQIVETIVSALRDAECRAPNPVSTPPQGISP